MKKEKKFRTKGKVSSTIRISSSIQFFSSADQVEMLRWSRRLGLIDNVSCMRMLYPLGCVYYNIYCSSVVIWVRFWLSRNVVRILQSIVTSGKESVSCFRSISVHIFRAFEPVVSDNGIDSVALRICRWTCTFCM